MSVTNPILADDMTTIIDPILCTTEPIIGVKKPLPLAKTAIRLKVRPKKIFHLMILIITSRN